ncbi:MAG: type II toxin-antitoxin system HicB family antitoxin [Synergistaceae bacterium]|nr:type II toxin-antitoxin system HicB family antitoxin [Synergistaceae bacterium]
MKYVYPAVFTEEYVAERGTVFTVVFPDVLGCVTEGDSLSGAIEMAREALAGCICSMQQRNEAIPVASPLEDVQCKDGFVSLIDLDMFEYKRKTENRAIKRTVSLPLWLDTMAQNAGLNFSQTIQDALKERLGVHQ